MKRFFDVAVSLVMLLVAWPLMLIIALAIKCSSKGSVIFKQKRLGLNGKPFTIYKFRTMYVGSEQYYPTVKKDRRVTVVGRVLRPIRLDEMPQLVNILRGDMSLVGPRPRCPQQIEDLSEIIPDFSNRLKIKPGLTGLAQVRDSCDDETDSAHRKFLLDMQYIEQKSMLMDIKILFQTIGVIFARKGL